MKKKFWDGTSEGEGGEEGDRDEKSFLELPREFHSAVKNLKIMAYNYLTVCILMILLLSSFLFKVQKKY